MSAPEPRMDVFISYARPDAAVARNLADTLWNEGFDVWFDDQLYAGVDWESVLLETVGAARAVVVLWSRQSVGRPWVVREADIARRAGRLVPIRIDECVLPPRFQAQQIAMMDGWDGRAHHPELRRVVEGLARLIPTSRIENVRPGFETDFLGVELPLPAVAGVAEEFRYLHFSVVMSAERRLPLYVAYNAAQPRADVPRGEVWRPDPLLPAAFQPRDGHFRGTGLDRGHLVAPLTVSWGSRREALIANHQTFFWTNNVPMHPSMNRSWWYCVEAWEREQLAFHDRAVGFAGPVLRRDDPVHAASETAIGRLRVQENFRLPRQFWKILVFATRSGGWRTAAFFFDQEALLRDPPARVEPSAFRVPIALIQLTTGI